MNYPNQPYGQGFSGQPGYFQQPGWPQQPGYPQPGYPGGYPPPPRGPSGATGILAGLLALFGGLVGIGLGAVAIFALFFSGQEERDARMFLSPVIGFAYALLLLIGAILLFRRKSIGRWLIIGGSAAVLVFWAFLGGTVIGVSDEPRRDLVAIGIRILAGLVFPILTLVMTFLPSTTKWIQAKPNRSAAQHYPPYLG